MYRNIKEIADEAYYQRKPNVPKVPGQRGRLEQLLEYFAEGEEECLHISISEDMAHITIFEMEGEIKHADKDIHTMMEEKGLLAEWDAWPPR
ncbi:Ff.00g133690.m01.CDS01 [Fusarium sp. VM40]|nr:Ff.00g133690.m01.CDS01 [Fusarium sp. VM40]